MNTTRLTHTRFVILSIVLSGGIFVDDLSPPRALAGGVPYGDSSVVSATASVFVAPTPAQIGSDQTSPQNISKRPDNDRLVDRYDWQAWTTQDGLPQNSVSDIVQTRDGYLWLATFGGLARFDGVRFKVYDLSNTEALTSNRILSLLEDRNGNLWIGTQGVGVVRLRDGVFTSFLGQANAPRGEVWSIVEDRDGIVWFGGRNLVRYADGQFEAAGPDEWMKRNRQVWSLFVDREQSLWVATSKGLGRLRNGQWRVFQVADGLPVDDIRFVHEDARGLLWARSIDRLCYFDGDRFVESLVQGERPSWIFAAAVDGRGDYWVGSGNGLFHARPMRKEGDDSSDRTLFQRAIERSVAGRVRALLEDREGNIWVGTDGDGLLRIRAAAFKPITPPSGFDAGSAVRALAGDGSGGLWIHFGGRNIVHLQDDEWKKLPANDDIGQIHSIKSGGDGTLWIRHGRKRLSKFRGGHFTHLEQELDHLRGFFVDRNGTVWLLSAGRLSMVRDGQTKPIVVGEGMPTGGGGSVTDSRDGTIWIGGEGTLIGYRDGEFRRYTTADGMPRGRVRSIHEGSDGNLWIAMYGGGMARLRNDTFTRYTTLEGLPDNSLGKILEDDAGNLWINSNRGVFRVSLDELNEFAAGQRSSVNCRTLGTGEGKGQSGAQTADGKLWFPTLDGLITIEPKLVTANEVPPPIVIETVRVSDQLFDATDRIELPLGRRNVVIEYTGLSFVDPDSVTFRYRLMGYDEDWVDAGARRRAEYRHIAPGTYEFQVQASNNDHVWSEHPATLGITLPAHFYETRAFYAACLFGVGLMGFVGLRARTRTMRIRNAALLESEAKYSDLYDNAPDMFCSVDAATGKVIECNLTLAAATGYSKNELIGRHISDLYHPDCEMDRQKVFKAFAQFGDVHDAELQLLRKDGSTIDVSLNVSAVRDEQGNVVHSRSIWRDITERRQAQAALEESEKRSRTELAELQHIYNAAPVGLCLMDTNLRYLRINQWLADINGISIENHIGRTLREIVPEIAESMEPVYRKVVDTGEPALDVLATGTTPANPQDVRHFMASYYPLKSPAGVVWGLSSIVRDVTERKRAEKVIQEKEKQLDNLLSNVGVIVLEGDPFNIYYVGGQAERILGYRKEQWFDDPDGPVGFWSKHLHPDDQDKIELCRRAIESGKDHAYEYRMIAADGREVWFYDTVTVETEHGRPVKTRSVMVDITESKRAEALKIGQQNILELISRGSASLPDILEAIVDFTENQCPDVRASILRVQDNKLQHGAAPSMPATYIELINGFEIGPNAASCGTAAYRKKRVIVADVATDPLWADYRHLGAAYGFSACWSEPILDSSGEVLGTFALYREDPGGPTDTEIQLIECMSSLSSLAIERKQAEEALRKAHEDLEQKVEQRTAELVAANARLRDEIKERHEAEREVRASERRYRAVVEDQTELICRWKPDGRLLFVNDAYCRYYDGPREAFIGHSFMPRIADEDRASVQEHLASLSLARPVATHQHRAMTAGGQLRWQQWTNRAIFDAQGRLSEYQAVGQDITERRQAEAQVHKHQEELAHLSRLGTMGEMATGLAHELNQPLTSIVNYTSGCVQRIQAGQPDLQELVTVLNEASSEAQRAGEIIKRIRRFVQKREPVRTLIDIPELIEQVLHLMRYELRSQGIQTRVEIEEHMPTLQGDRIELQQVLINLLRNSIEAMNGTEMKQRHLTIGAATTNEDSVTVFVRDAGCGLGEADPDKIFEPFYTTREDGTGMGLAISRTIIEAHGGELKATNNADVGCTFHFSLPRNTRA